MGSADDNLRPVFVSGALLRAEDLSLEQQLARERFQAANRGLHGVGVASGLEVRDAGNGTVEVSPGLAIDADGRQLSLSRARTLDLRTVPAANVYLVLRAQDTPADFEGNTRGTWPRRILEAPALTAQPWPPEDPGRALVLAKVELSVSRQVVRILPDARQACGLTVGALALSDGTAEVARLTAGADAGALTITAPKTDLFGDARITGALGVGSSPPSAGVEVVGTPAVPGTGQLVLSQDRAFGLGTRFGQELAAGDRLVVDGVARVVEAVRGANLLSLAPPTPGSPPPLGDPRPFSMAARLLVRIALGDGTPAVAVTAQGALGVGTFEPRERLHVANGDLALDAGSTVIFSGDGLLWSADAGKHAVRFDASQSKLTLQEAGDLLFEAGEVTTGSDPAPSLAVTGENGFVGVGVRAPPDALTVQGTIEAQGGLVFADKTVQKTGVVPIPIGTVVDWWRPNSSLQLGPEGFQICDGSTVSDPDSPLQGTRLPDLRGLFVRGVVSFEQIGTTGGSADHAHDVPLGNHTHPLDHQHAIQAIFQPTSQTSGTDLGGHSLAVASHVHALGGSGLTDNPTPDVSTAYLGQSSVQTNKANNIPPYMDMLKIMRIK